MAYLLTDKFQTPAGSYGFYQGRATYSTTDSTNSFTITLTDMGELWTSTGSSSSTYSSSYTATITATLKKGSTVVFSRSATKSSRSASISSSSSKYISFYSTSTSQTITKTSSSQIYTLVLTWSDGYQGTQTKSVNITVPAIGVINCSITYNANGGSSSSLPSPNPQTYTYSTSGSTNLSSTEPTRTGYSFNGWSLDSTATSGWEAGHSWSRANKGDFILYATWKAHTRTFVFNNNNGSGTMANLVMKYAASGTQTLTENSFTREGYSFGGWADTDGGTTVAYQDKASISKSSITSTSTINLYAIWNLIRANPFINISQCTRVTTQDNFDDEGENLQLGYSYTFADTNSTNKKIEIFYKTPTDVSYNLLDTISISSSSTEGESGDNPFVSTGNLFDTDTSYNILVKISEEYQSREYSYTVTNFISQSFFIMDFGSKGYAIGIGCAAANLEDLEESGGTVGAEDARLDIGIPAFIEPKNTQIPYPSEDKHIATKEYVDNSIPSIPSFGDWQTISRSTMTGGWTATSDGFLTITGEAASGYTPYVYIYTTVGTGAGSVYNVFVQNCASGGRLGGTFPVKQGWTYTMLYDSTNSHWNGTESPDNRPRTRFMPIE